MASAIDDYPSLKAKWVVMQHAGKKPGSMFDDLAFVPDHDLLDTVWLDNPQQESTGKKGEKPWQVDPKAASGPSEELPSTAVRDAELDVVVNNQLAAQDPPAAPPPAAFRDDMVSWLLDEAIDGTFTADAWHDFAAAALGEAGKEIHKDAAAGPTDPAAKPPPLHAPAPATTEADAFQKSAAFGGVKPGFKSLRPEQAMVSQRPVGQGQATGRDGVAKKTALSNMGVAALLAQKRAISLKPAAVFPGSMAEMRMNSGGAEKGAGDPSASPPQATAQQQAQLAAAGSPTTGAASQSGAPAGPSARALSRSPPAGGASTSAAHSVAAGALVSAAPKPLPYAPIAKQQQQQGAERMRGEASADAFHASTVTSNVDGPGAWGKHERDGTGSCAVGGDDDDTVGAHRELMARKNTCGTKDSGIHPGSGGGGGGSWGKRSREESENMAFDEADAAEESGDTRKTNTTAKRMAVSGNESSAAKRARAAEVHNMSERRRRDRINERMKTLQELIPNSNKTDKASMLDEAIEYLKMLQLQLQ
ncbi:unnamed protein product, partial [Closterium sp. Yama58-4]